MVGQEQPLVIDVTVQFTQQLVLLRQVHFDQAEPAIRVLPPALDDLSGVPSRRRETRSEERHYRCGYFHRLQVYCRAR